MKQKFLSLLVVSALMLSASLFSGCGSETSTAAPWEPGLMDSYFTNHDLKRHVGRIEVNDVLVGVRVSVASSYTISRIALQVYKEGTPQQNVVVAIFDHNPVYNEPGTRIGPWSTPVNNAEFQPFPGTKVMFAGLNAPVTPGTYWIVAYTLSGSGDNTSNYSAIAGSSDTENIGDEHLQPDQDHWGEKIYAQVNFWLYADA